MTNRWHEYFLRLALETSRMSKDPSTQVGAVLTVTRYPASRPNVISTGFNGFPFGIADNEMRLKNRDVKLELVVHAEINAVMAAARMGTSTAGSTLYVAATDGTREIWGGPPCIRCTVEAIQAGVVEFVSRPMAMAPSRWHDSIKRSKTIILEAGLKYLEIPPLE